jgi:hypothetical protein
MYKLASAMYELAVPTSESLDSSLGLFYSKVRSTDFDLTID